MSKPLTLTEDTAADATLDAAALIYVRVSSAQQADKDYDPEGFSIPAQREACTRKATSLGAQVVEIRPNTPLAVAFRREVQAAARF